MGKCVSRAFLLLAVVVMVLAGGAYAAVTYPTYQWHTFYGSRGGDDSGQSVARDATGNIYIAGRSSANWSGDNGAKPLHAFSGTSDIFILKLDSSGGYLWHTFYRADAGDESYWPFGLVTAVAVDFKGNVYVAGESDVGWNGDNGAKPLHAFSGTTNAFLLKLDSSGAYQWHTFHDGSGAFSHSRATCLAIDGVGNIYVGGSAGSGARCLSILVVKFSAAGGLLWERSYGSTGNDAGGMAIDKSGNVYVTGYSISSWLGGNDANPLHPHAGSNQGQGGMDIFVLKLNSSGGYQWHTFHGAKRIFAMRGQDFGRGVAADKDGNIYVAGSSDSPWLGDADAAPLHPHTWAGGLGECDIVVLKLDGSGAYQWHTFHGAAYWADGDSLYGIDDYANGAAVDGSGGVHVTGSSPVGWKGDHDENPRHPHTYANGPGKDDLFLMKLDGSGAYQWHTFYGSKSGGDVGRSVTVNDGGNAVIAGDGDAGWRNGSSPPLHFYSGKRDVFALFLGGDMARVTTVAAKDITATSATSGGTVLSDGGLTVTERGVCFSPLPHPITSGECTRDGSGKGAFTSSPAGLASHMTYYVRAYATNSAGTAYGNEVHFSTLQGPPDRYNLTVGKLGTGSGVVSVTDGSDCTEFPCVRTFDGGTTLTITAAASGSVFAGWSGSKGSAASCTGKGPCTFDLATDSSVQASFLALPAVVTRAAKGITSRSAIGGGRVDVGGGNRGVCWSTSPNPTTSGQCTHDGSGDGSFSSNMTGLAPGKLYHVRAYSTTSIGTAYGDDLQFTTAPAAPLAFITNQTDGTVSVIDTGTNTVVGSPILVGDQPCAAAVNGAGSRAYVVNVGDDSVSVINGTMNRVMGAAVQVGDVPYGIAVNPAGTRVYVANYSGGTVSVIDTATNTVDGPPISLGTAPYGIACSPVGDRAYVASPAGKSILVIDLATNTVVGTPITVEKAPYSIAISPSGSLVYTTHAADNAVSVINTATRTVVKSIAVGNVPLGIAVNPAGTRVYVTNSQDDTVSAIDTTTNTVVGSAIPVGDAPYGIAVNPAGTHVYVANHLSDNVSVINTATNKVVKSIAVGKGPFSLGQFIQPARP